MTEKRGAELWWQRFSLRHLEGSSWKFRCEAPGKVLGYEEVRIMGITVQLKPWIWMKSPKAKCSEESNKKGKNRAENKDLRK